MRLNPDTTADSGNAQPEGPAVLMDELVVTAPAVEASDLTVRLGDFTALDSVSFALPAGSFSAVLGPNGGGKTTLLRAVLGLVSAASGSVALFGQTASALPPLQIGYVPQLKTLDRSFPAQALELVVCGMRRRWSWRALPSERDAALAALRLVGAEHLADKSIAWLSGGELQRVYLARALARRPRLVLLDEPASGIDVFGEADMYHVLEDYRRETGAAVLMVTHDWGAAYHHADLVLLLNRQLVGFGPPATALSDEHMRAAFGHHGHDHAMGWERGRG